MPPQTSENDNDEPAFFYPLYGPREPRKDVDVVPTSVLERTSTSATTTSTTTTKQVDAETLIDDLTKLPCPAFTPHDSCPKGYLGAREDCWNASMKEWPSVIAMPSTIEEVQACIKMVEVVKHNRVAVLSGGHSAMCMPNDAFLISLRRMNSVVVNMEGSSTNTNPTVTCGGGAKIGEVDAVLKPYHLAVPLGTHPDTGIGGLTLGGGIGWLTPRVGLAIDNLVEAEVVLADGTLVTASPTSHEDLYWALRGGGGNFGIVVSFTYRVFPIGGADGFEPGYVLGGIVPFPLEQFDRATVIEKYGADCLQTDADNVQMLLLPNGGPCISVFTHHGTMQDSKKALEELGTGYAKDGLDNDKTIMPPKDGVKAIPWTDGVQTLTGMGDPNGAGDLLAPGNPFYYTAGFVEQITPELATFLAKAQHDAPSQKGIHAGGAIVIMPLNGPFNNVPAKATAVTARNAKFWVVFLLRLDGNADDQEEGIAWGRSLKKEFMAMEGVVTDMRLNKPGSSLLVDEATHSVLPSQNEGCVETMREIKEKYDPKNLFCFASLSK